MSPGTRSTPVLLRRGPLTGSINVLTNYRYVNGGATIHVATNGKHDVTGDFDALVCEFLLDPAPDALPLLDQLSDDEDFMLGQEQRDELRRFYDALRAIVDRHNIQVDEVAGPSVAGGTR
jgi:hypothetical protein